MKAKFIAIIALILSLASCSKNEVEENTPISTNKVLLLKVDYTTNTFEGGKEFTFPNSTADMTITNEFVSPGDFGSVKLSYQEVNETLFDGTIIWMGLGQMTYPQNLLNSNQFDSANTADVVNPGSGFQNVFNPDNSTFDYNPVWLSVQRLVKVREYLNSNPNATVKIFLYTPSVGIGNPAEWDWIIFIKN